MITYEQIKSFCDPDGLPNRMNPWTTPDGKTAATDSKVMIVVDGVFPETPEMVGKALDVTRHIEAIRHNTQLLDTSGVEIKKRVEKCFACDGAGEVFFCSKCDGAGEVECNECGHDGPCSKCNGTGYQDKPRKDGLGETCEDCGGDGLCAIYENVEIQGFWFAGMRLEKIMKLPGFRNLRMETGKIHDPVAFDFDGGCGLIMPLSMP